MARRDPDSGAYRHSRDRARERYGYDLTPADWLKISRMIGKASRRSVNRGITDGVVLCFRHPEARRSVWRVIYDNRRFRVCFCDVDKVVISFLTLRGVGR